LPAHARLLEEFQGAHCRYIDIEDDKMGLELIKKFDGLHAVEGKHRFIPHADK